MGISVDFLKAGPTGAVDRGANAETTQEIVIKKEDVEEANRGEPCLDQPSCVIEIVLETKTKVVMKRVLLVFDNT